MVNYHGKLFEAHAGIYKGHIVKVIGGAMRSGIKVLEIGYREEGFKSSLRPRTLSEPEFLRDFREVEA